MPAQIKQLRQSGGLKLPSLRQKMAQRRDSSWLVDIRLLTAPHDYPEHVKIPPEKRRACAGRRKSPKARSNYPVILTVPSQAVHTWVMKGQRIVADDSRGWRTNCKAVH